MDREFYRIYGIMEQEDIDGKITLLEICRIFKALNVPDYYLKFEELLYSKNKVNTKQKVNIKAVFSMLDYKDFVFTLPLRCNNHPTYINLLLLKAAFMVYMKHLLTIPNIKLATSAFFEAEKFFGTTNIPLDPVHINTAMKYANRVMSEDKIRAWLDRYSAVLSWKEDYRRASAKDGKRMKVRPDKYMALYPHEFLFLICNSTDRNEYIQGMVLHKENYVEKQALRNSLVPMEILTINPACRTLEEEIQRRLNAEHRELSKGNVMYEGVHLPKKPGTAPSKPVKSIIRDIDIKKTLGAFLKAVTAFVPDITIIETTPKTFFTRSLKLGKCTPISAELKKSPVYHKFNQLHSRRLKVVKLTHQPFICMTTPAKPTKFSLDPQHTNTSPRLAMKKYHTLLHKRVVSEKLQKVIDQEIM